MSNYQTKKLFEKKIEIQFHWIYLADEVGFKVAQAFHIEKSMDSIFVKAVQAFIERKILTAYQYFEKLESEFDNYSSFSKNKNYDLDMEDNSNQNDDIVDLPSQDLLSNHN